MFIIKKISSDTEASETYVTELDNLLSLYIPLADDLYGHSGYVVYRYHNGIVEKISEKVNSNGEYLEFSEDGSHVILHVKNFSDYAIGWKTTFDYRWVIIDSILAVLFIGEAIALGIVCSKRKNKNEENTRNC